jgi:plasmid stabilization system protein ParE
MSRRIILSPDARVDLDTTARWYRRKETNLSRRFKAEVDITLFRVARHPYASLRVNDRVRRVLMNRFPYRVDFSLDDTGVTVLAITHQRRSDAIWKDRINNVPEDDQ